MEITGYLSTHKLRLKVSPLFEIDYCLLTIDYLSILQRSSVVITIEKETIVKKTIMTISGPVSLSLYRICVIFGILLCLTSCARTGDNKEEHYDTYETFKDRQENIAPYLPESSTEIQHYAILDFDTNYHFIEATVKIESLSNFLFLNNNFEGQFTCSDITYSDQKFDRLFYKKPIWWNEKSLVDYEENHLCLFVDSSPKNVSRGCWIFYDKETQKIRVFIWSQQWLSLENIKTILLSDEAEDSNRVSDPFL